MARPHLPRHCPTCQRIASAYAALAALHPGIAPVNAQVTAEAQISRRALQYHRPALIEGGFIRDNQLTGQSLLTPEGQSAAGDGEPLTPRDWLASITVSCRTCRTILADLVSRTRGAWRGQVRVTDIAKAVGMDERTVRLHARTGHEEERRLKHPHSLVGDGLVTFEADGETIAYKDGRPILRRRPDRYTLRPAQAPAFDIVTMPGSPDWFTDGIADRLQRETVWFDPAHVQAPKVAWLVGELVRGGWPVEVLMSRLCVDPLRMPLLHPYKWAKRRLPDRGQAYVVTVLELGQTPRCANPNCDAELPGPTVKGYCPACETVRRLFASPRRAAEVSVDLAAARRQRPQSRSAYALAGPAADPSF
ncbi:hypothetical protein [Streptomyces sp. NPDC088731]|uniref:hypothetical protein n=1 Tax=Streptomyces sp. NPDC088731 TaxID=3365878 RepID=UPI0037FBCCA3